MIVVDPGHTSTFSDHIICFYLHSDSLHDMMIHELKLSGTLWN